MKTLSKTLLKLFLLSASMSIHMQGASQRTVERNDQYWIGYMTSTMVADKYSIWNDFHLVPEGFAVVRTGLTRHMQNTSVTGGYAFLWLPPGGGNTHLRRHEHRPWAQIQLNLPVAGPYSFVQRVRYDARFRENVESGEVLDGFSFNHRVRFLMSLKRNLSNKTEREFMPYVAVSNEVLLNFGKEITYNTFDQNRISVSLGVQHKKTQYQLGFMNRFVQNGPSRYTLNHTLVFWVTQRFDLKKMLDKRAHPETVSE
jgi:hypothetical protein